MNTLSTNKFLATIAAYLFVAATAVPALHAQFVPEDQSVSVPFAFDVGETHLPAGQYVISTRDHVLSIRGESTQALLMVNHEEANGPAQVGKLVFSHYGDQYFVREVWSRGSSNYESCVESKGERKIRAAIAANTHKRADGVQIAVEVMPKF